MLPHPKEPCSAQTRRPRRKLSLQLHGTNWLQTSSAHRILSGLYMLRSTSTHERIAVHEYLKYCPYLGSRPTKQNKTLRAVESTLPILLCSADAMSRLELRNRTLTNLSRYCLNPSAKPSLFHHVFLASATWPLGANDARAQGSPKLRVLS